MKPKLAIPSLRRWLISLHRDLISIHSNILLSSDAYPRRLTEFERHVLVLEDRRFFSHRGVSWRSLLREALKPLVFMKPRGASTIDMQFVRTATGRYERSISRKFREIILSYLIQFRYNKIVILRSYLNIAYFGTGLKGAQAALEHAEFVDDISGIQAAFIASHLVYPRPIDKNDTWKKRVSRRANYINSVYVRRKKRFDKIEGRIFR